jgi:Reverse transcriptase (RNA-dependent DNA polymerase)
LTADECVFFQGTTIFMVYVDDGVLIDLDGSKIEEALSGLKSRFDVQDEGDLCDYLGVQVCKHLAGSIEFTLPQLIDSILEDLKLLDHGGSNQAKATDTPCRHDSMMNEDECGKEFDYSWAYCSVIGKLNYLEKSTQGGLVFSVHQCASMCKIHVPTYADTR